MCRLSTWLIALLPIASSCATHYELEMEARRKPITDNVISMELDSREYDSIIVLPPHGLDQRRSDLLSSILEKELLRNGMRLVTSSITGRVVLEDPNEEAQRRIEGAAQLPKSERALIMASETGANAYLAIANWSWSEKSTPTRFFVLEKETAKLKETDRDDWLFAEPDERFAFTSPVLSFLGTLVDMNDGEIIASFDFRYPANWCLPEDYHAELETGPNGALVIEKESFPYMEGSWFQQARDFDIPGIIFRQIAKSLRAGDF